MRLTVRCIEITSVKRAHSEMDRIGVDPVGIRIMAPKQFHYNLKVENLTPAQANVIKQEMLSAGGEAAVAKGAASCAVKATDAILSGTLKQYNILIEKLHIQSFGLPEVAVALRAALANIGKRSFTIKGRTKSWELGERTLIMGILNVTPDSFFDGGRHFEVNAAVERGLEMVEQGADWIDVGGESTRPGATPVDEKEELKRVLPVVGALSKKGITVSIDTTKAAVAKEAIEAGAEIVNDISALGMDKGMAGVCARANCPVILMHMRGTPLTMQKNVEYGDITGEVYNYLSSRLDYSESHGIDPEKTIVDPGLGFGKSREGNITLIRNLPEFRTLGRPILLGASRKSFMGATVGETGVEAGADSGMRLSGTIAVCAMAILKGAQILRVHDVKETLPAVRMADAIKKSADSGAKSPELR